VNIGFFLTFWNWAGFFTEGLETRWKRFGQFLNDL